MIDYGKIDAAETYYKRAGFVRIESPWVVSKATSAITKPPERQDNELVHNGKVLVASGEQSFLYLYLKRFLPAGTYQTTTPCFRRENFDFLHSKYFMKTELIDTLHPDPEQLEYIIDVCLWFFKRYIPTAEVVSTENGYDIVANGMELGSYGLRQCAYLDWIYATGVAEPRLSRVMGAI